MFGVTVRQRIVFGTDPFPRGRIVRHAEARALRSLTPPFAPFIGLELTGENGFYCQIKSIRWCLDTMNLNVGAVTTRSRPTVQTDVVIFSILLIRKLRRVGALAMLSPRMTRIQTSCDLKACLHAA